MTVRNIPPLVIPRLTEIIAASVVRTGMDKRHGEKSAKRRKVMQPQSAVEVKPQSVVEVDPGYANKCNGWLNLVLKKCQLSRLKGFSVVQAENKDFTITVLVSS